MKEFEIGSFWPEACGGAPAPPRWNARSVRVFGSFFTAPGGKSPPGPGVVCNRRRTHPGAKRLLSLRPTPPGRGFS